MSIAQIDEAQCCNSPSCEAANIRGIVLLLPSDANLVLRNAVKRRLKHPASEEKDIRRAKTCQYPDCHSCRTDPKRGRDRAISRAGLSQNIELQRKLQLIRDQFGFQPAIQGEVIGPGIQKNKYGLAKVDLHVFSMIDIDRYSLVDRDLMLSALESAGLTGVPQLGEFVLNHTIDELVDFAVGKSRLNPKAHREGLVFRPAQEIHDATLGGRLSFKVINPQFLLKYDE